MTKEPKSGSSQARNPVHKRTPTVKRGRIRSSLSRTLPDSDFLVYNILGHQFHLPLLEGGCETKDCILISATILFAQRGYSAVSIRDIARANGVKPSSLYNHFASKEALWEAALEHLMELFFLYFERLDRAISQARSFEEVLGIVLYEPKRMSNNFTTYGFSLINLEQLNDPLAAEAQYSMFNHGINFLKEKFDDCVAKGWIQPFDTFLAGTLIMNSVYMGLTAKVQEFEGRPVVYRVEDMIGALERFILSAAGAKVKSFPGLEEKSDVGEIWPCNASC